MSQRCKFVVLNFINTLNIIFRSVESCATRNYIARLYPEFSWLINSHVTVLLVRSRYQENYLSPDYLEAPGQINPYLRSGTIKYKNPVFLRGLTEVQT